MKPQTKYFNPITRLIERWPFLLLMFSLWMLFHLNIEFVTVISGVVVSVFMTWFASYVLYDEQGFRLKTFSLWMLIKYIRILLFEITFSSISYVKTVLKGNAIPIVFTMSVDVDDPIKVALIANSITLTPGTVSIDVNGKDITVLAIITPGTTVDDVKKPIQQKFEAALKVKRK
jgi:multicomponent Na+:H+ antiporter subunit E